MNHIEAMKQALEALDLMYACYAHPEWISHKQQEDKILAQCVSTTMTLRQAIAKAEQERKVHDRHCNQGEWAGSCKFGDLNCPTIAEAEQEPVAYRYKMPVEDDYWVYNYCTYPDNKDDPRCEPLYTHPDPDALHAAYMSGFHDGKKAERRERSDRWVGLTEDEFYDLDDVGRKMILEYGRLVEAKLKEKNT